jgi:hypothetical protein
VNTLVAEKKSGRLNGVGRAWKIPAIYKMVLKEEHNDDPLELGVQDLRHAWRCHSDDKI